MADQWMRTVECEDASGRPRSVKVYPSTTNRAVLLPPPGDACVLTLAQLGQLQTKLAELTAELHRRGADT
jgi:hypothetical protein